MITRRSAAAMFALSLFAVACGSDDDAADSPSTEAPAPTDAAADASAGTDATSEPVTGPASITAENQTGDGASVTVASVSLPTEGFVVVHADDAGSPGPILGWSDLLPAGESADVVVSLQDPLAASGTVFPMAHVDANTNGVYEFMPPDVTIDVPATTADGGVAVLPISYEIEGDAGEAAPDKGAILGLSATDLGEIVVDSAGNTLYLFVPDAQGESTCYDQCEDTWPIVKELTGVGEGLDGSLLGATTRTNGDVQATYNGWPLYRFGPDVVPGDTNGQGVGDVWYVLDGAGDAIGT